MYLVNFKQMRKIILFLIAVSFLFNACNKKKDDFIVEVVHKTTKTQSIHYKITQKDYYSNGQDTTITPFEVWAIRDSKDSLRNGYVWVDNYYRPYNMIYDNGNFYLAIPPKKLTALYPHFTESFISPVDWIDVFLNPEIFKEQYTDSQNLTSLSDTSYHGEACKKVQIKFPAGKKKEKTTITYIFSKKQLVPLLAVAKTEYKNSVYYDELFFSNYEFDKVSSAALHQRQDKVLTENPIENRAGNSELEMLEGMLHTGDKAPLFDGEFYTGKDKFNLSEYMGKNIIIIDFWYTHCPPCVKAIPALSDLYKEYKESGLKIFGVNSVDNQEHSFHYLHKFLSKREISYDIIMIRPEVDLKYKIARYPTLYIIDKKGEIAYAELGTVKKNLKN